MRSYFTLLLFNLFISSCHHKSQNISKQSDTEDQQVTMLEQSKTINGFDTSRAIQTELKSDTLPKISPETMILISSGEFSTSTRIEINGSDFDLVTKGNDTIYLATKDNKFQTPEGYKVGTRFFELSEDIQSGLTQEPGWGYYYRLPSGWSIGFCEGTSCTDQHPENSSQVKWIFRRQ